RKNYNGRNIRELARQFGLSERRVRQILHKPK
ncbi:MAG: sigma factor-like helix-turn-helix DNA-binding protein, partial [Porcipelethomonas sp.]